MLSDATGAEFRAASRVCSPRFPMTTTSVVTTVRSWANVVTLPRAPGSATAGYFC